MEGRGALPEAPEPRHAVFRCSIEESPRTVAAASFSYPAFFLACEAWLASGGAAERVAAVKVEPSPSLDLGAALQEEDAGVGSMSSADLEAAVYAAMMESAIDGMAAAFERALYEGGPARP
jgi:hypothetical protein